MDEPAFVCDAVNSIFQSIWTKYVTGYGQKGVTGV